MLQQTTASLRPLSVLHLKVKPSIQSYGHCLANKKSHLLNLTKQIGKSFLNNYGNFFLHFLDCFIPFKVTERALERVPAVHHRALCEQLWDQYLAQGYSGIVLQVYLHLPLLQEHFPCFVQGLERRTLQFAAQRLRVYWPSANYFIKLVAESHPVKSLTCQRKHLRRSLLKYG